MRPIFVDTSFFVAILNEKDKYHDLAGEMMGTLPHPMLTTQWVLAELGNWLSYKATRDQLPFLIAEMENDSDFEILPADDASFRAGLKLYAGRPDKDWSFIDCISMSVMQSLSLTDVLTADRHFQQAGFKALLL